MFLYLFQKLIITERLFFSHKMLLHILLLQLKFFYGFINGKIISIHIQKPEGKRKSTRLVCNELYKYKYKNSYAPFFDGISFKSIRTIEKRRPAVRHTFEGLIITNPIHTEIISPSKVCRTAGRLFSMVRMLLKRIHSKNDA